MNGLSALDEVHCTNRITKLCQKQTKKRHMYTKYALFFWEQNGDGNEQDGKSHPHVKLCAASSINHTPGQVPSNKGFSFLSLLRCVTSLCTTKALRKTSNNVNRSPIYGNTSRTISGNPDSWRSFHTLFFFSKYFALHAPP